MFLTTSCVMSAKVRDAVASLHLFSVPVSPVCNITVSNAGCRFTQGQVVSTINHSSRRELIDRGHYHSVGAEPVLPAHHTWHTFILLQFFNICYFSGFSMVSLYFYCREV